MVRPAVLAGGILGCRPRVSAAPKAGDGDAAGGWRRWAPVVAAVAFAIVVLFLLPSGFVTSAWPFFAVLEACLLVAMLVMDPGRIESRSGQCDVFVWR